MRRGPLRPPGKGKGNARDYRHGQRPPPGRAGRGWRPVPTTDPGVKEGMFNALQFDIEGRRVLDLFAGTGQLGIEC